MRSLTACTGVAARGTSYLPAPEGASGAHGGALHGTGEAAEGMWLGLMGPAHRVGS